MFETQIKTQTGGTISIRMFFIYRAVSTYLPTMKTMPSMRRKRMPTTKKKTKEKKRILSVRSFMSRSIMRTGKTISLTERCFDDDRNAIRWNILELYLYMY